MRLFASETPGLLRTPKSVSNPEYVVRDENKFKCPCLDCALTFNGY